MSDADLAEENAALRHALYLAHRENQLIHLELEKAEALAAHRASEDVGMQVWQIMARAVEEIRIIQWPEDWGAPEGWVREVSLSRAAREKK